MRNETKRCVRLTLEVNFMLQKYRSILYRDSEIYSYRFLLYRSDLSRLFTLKKIYLSTLVREPLDAFYLIQLILVLLLNILHFTMTATDVNNISRLNY